MNLDPEIEDLKAQIASLRTSRDQPNITEGMFIALSNDITATQNTLTTLYQQHGGTAGKNIFFMNISFALPSSF